MEPTLRRLPHEPLVVAGVLFGCAVELALHWPAPTKYLGIAAGMLAAYILAQAINTWRNYCWRLNNGLPGCGTPNCIFGEARPKRLAWKFCPHCGSNWPTIKSNATL